jgi:hypothetical protein
VSRVTRTPEQTAAIESWRVRYETDPLVTYKQIGAEAGVSEHLVRSYANAAGWCRAPEVHAAMLRLASSRGNAARWANYEASSPASVLRDKRRASATPPLPVAPASVWDWGSMHAVVTSRGQHRRIEVSA